MDSARWQRIQDVFHDAADLPESEQQSFLKTACGDDTALMSEVLAMLHQDATSDSLLDRGLAGVAQQTVAQVLPGYLTSKEFGPYRIKKLLGEGGMGVVYLAERKDLGSEVAIKVLRDAWLSPARRERFASEQRTLAQLSHPSIALEGIPLTQYCREHQSSIEERLQLFRSVCEAVEHAHSHAVIHRDLKPSNILVKSDGTVRLLDFGIAKQLESLDLQVDQTMTGLRLMTPAYAAPEQIRGDRVGINTDVYSLGVILFELLTGQLPFDLSNLTPVEAATIIAQHEPGKPSAAVKRVTNAEANSHALSASKTAWADLDVLCLTAMHKDPVRRYRSVEALIRDVAHYLNGEPLEARPDRLGYRTAKFVRRNGSAVATAAFVFAVIIGPVTFFTVRLAKARDAAMAEAARTQRIQKFMTNLFQGGDPSAGPADSLRVVTLLDRGVQQAQSLNAEPEVQAELYETLGTLYENLGKFDQANSLLNSALAQRKSLFGSDHPQVAETLVALGLLRDDQANLPEAEHLVREGLEMTKRHLPANHPAAAKATTALGKVLEDRGSYDAAIQVLNQAVDLQSAKGTPTPELAASLYELANSHFYAGHYDTAESLNQRLLPLYRQIYGERHPRARTLVFENRYDEAAGLLQQSLAIKERVYGKVHPSVASSLNELGNTAVRQGNYDAAEHYFTRMADIYRAIYGEHHYLLGIALSNLAGVYASRQDWPRAEKLFRQAVRLFTETQSANHINTGIARTKLGRTLLHERRYAEAETESRAGYDILIKQMSPGASWLVNARKDLVEEYDALKQPQQAAEFRAELTAAEPRPANTSTKK